MKEKIKFPDFINNSEVNYKESVAIARLNKKLMIIGLHDPDHNGYVLLYIYIKNKWVYSGSIEGTTQGFGYSVSLTDDGSELLVGSYFNYKVDNASIYRYKLSIEENFQIEILPPIDITTNTFDTLSYIKGFISGDGETSVVLTNSSITRESSFYIFEKDKEEFSPKQRLKVKSKKGLGYLADTVSLNGDGSIIYVSQFNDDDDSEVLVFRRDELTEDFVKFSKIKCMKRGESKLFGIGICTNVKGDVVYITNPLESYRGDDKVGKIYVFTYTPFSNSFAPTGVLMSDTDSYPDKLFGYTLAVDDSGSVMLVGMFEKNFGDSGIYCQTRP